MADLRELREEARIYLDEQNASLYSDAEIDKNINRGLNHAARATQLLRFPFQKQSNNGVGEYGCIAGLTDVISVKYFNGNQLFPLKQMDPAKAALFTKQTRSRPTHYYLKIYTPLLEYQNATNNISLTEVNSRDKKDWRTIVGIYPPPDSDNGVITIDAYIEHPKLRKDEDRCLLPEAYEDIAVFFAVFKGMLKAKYYAEAETYKGLFQGLLDNLADYSAQGASVAHPMVKLSEDLLDDGDCMPISKTWVD